MYFQARKNTDLNQYFVVAFDPIKISTHYAPQNDRWNLSFVKDIYVVAKKMTTNGRKMSIFETYIFDFFSSKIEKQTCQGHL